MRPLAVYLRAYSSQKHVRPWALAAPVVVLLICLPLLHPLRFPAAWQMSDDEMSRYGTVQALVEQQTFSIDQTQFVATTEKTRVGDTWYSDQPPVPGLLLAGPYWLLYHCGFSFRHHPAVVEYLLTLVAVTLPVAAAAGMLYRMGRLFELSRPWRTGLALGVVLGSGFISYGTVLNPYAPAAALLLLAVAILVQVSLSKDALQSGVYLLSAGFFAALAAVINPAAGIFTLMLGWVALTMPWRWSPRIAGMLMFVVGMLPPILLHMSLSAPITGDWRLGFTPLPAMQPLHSRHSPAGIILTDADDWLPANAPSTPQEIAAYLQRGVSAIAGPHGILTHFPVLVLGVLGLGIVLRKHWPGSTKALAVVTCIGTGVVLVHYIALPVDWRWAMFGVRWYVLVLPLCLFWAGAWVRRSHNAVTWTLAGLALLFSVIVSLIGATDPMPREGYDGYTVAQAWQHMQLYRTADEPPLARR